MHCMTDCSRAVRLGAARTGVVRFYMHDNLLSCQIMVLLYHTGLNPRTYNTYNPEKMAEWYGEI